VGYKEEEREDWSDVNKAIEILAGVQEADRELRRLAREEAGAPAARRAAEEVSAAAERVLAAAEKALREARADAKRAEGEIDAKREQIGKFRADQLKIKSNDGYRALENQIAAATAEIDGLEDAALEAMGRADGAEARAAEARKALEAARAETARRLAALEEEAVRRAAAKAEAEAARAERAAGAEPGLLARYEKIFAKWGDAAVVGVDHGACGGCHMKLAPSSLVDARKEGVVATCGFCGRILRAT